MVAICAVALLSGTFVGTFGEWLFELICHGIDARSLQLWEATLPVCARCTGIYAGVLVAGAITFTSGSRNIGFAWWLLALPLLIDGPGQALGLWDSTNGWRMVTGIFFGAGLLGLLLSMQLNTESIEPEVRLR